MQGIWSGRRGIGISRFVFRPLRALLSLALLVFVVWAAFKLPLGERTFAEHMDRIGQTPQAQELVDGARQRVNPVIEEAKDRMLGEYIEAPTHADVAVAEEEPRPSGRLPRSDSGP